MSKLLLPTTLFIMLSALSGCTTMTLDEMYDQYEEKQEKCPNPEMLYEYVPAPGSEGKDGPPTMIRQRVSPGMYPHYCY